MNGQESKMTGMRQLNLWCFFPAAIVLCSLMGWAALSPDSFTTAINAGLNFVVTNFGWVYVLGMFACVVFSFFVAFSKYGKIVIGGKDAKPDMSFFTWFYIALTGGIAIGIVFWAVAEPLTFFHNPPPFLGIEGGTPEAIGQSLRYVFFHWTITPYADFTACGIVLALTYYNCKRKYKVSTGLYPWLGDRADGRIGSLVDSVCIFAIIGCHTASVGLGAMQLVSGYNFISGQNVQSNFVYFLFVGGITLFSSLPPAPVCIRASPMSATPMSTSTSS